LPKAPLISVSEGNVIFERDDFKSALTNTVDDALLGQKLVGVCYDG
jgi:hypothetical protein